MDLADCSSKQNDKYNFAFKSTWPTIVLDQKSKWLRLYGTSGFIIRAPCDCSVRPSVIGMSKFKILCLPEWGNHRRDRQSDLNTIPWPSGSTTKSEHLHSAGFSSVYLLLGKHVKKDEAASLQLKKLFAKFVMGYPCVGPHIFFFTLMVQLFCLFSSYRVIEKYSTVTNFFMWTTKKCNGRITQKCNRHMSRVSCFLWKNR